MTIYLDLVFLQNFSMNFIMLYTTGKILGKNLKATKLIIASILGVMDVLLIVVNVPEIILNTSKVVMAVVMTMVAFGRSSYRRAIKDTIVFLMISFVFAGCALETTYFVKPKVVYIVNGKFVGGSNYAVTICVSAIISYLLIKIGIKIVNITHRIRKNDMICNLEIMQNENIISLNAFIDTGNLLSDPISKEPVTIVEWGSVKNVFPKDYIKKIECMMGGGLNKDFGKQSIKVRIIPYISMGNKNGVMVVCRVDEIKINYHEEVCCLKDALIGFSEEPLTKNGKYSALVGLQTLERGINCDKSNSNTKNEGKYSIC